MNEQLRMVSSWLGLVLGLVLPAQLNGQSGQKKGGDVLSHHESGNALSVVATTQESVDDFADARKLDRVVVRQGITSSKKLNVWKPLTTTVMVGTITNLDSRGVTIQTVKKGAESQVIQAHIPSEQLLAIDPVWQSTGIDGLVELFEKGRYAEFVRGLRDHDRSDIPEWQQLLLLEMVVRAVDSVQGPASSGQHFLKLAETAPEYLYAEMPLCWSTSEPGIDLILRSKEWLNSSDDVAQLLGASWLLLEVDSGNARTVLTKLRNSKNNAVAQLATAQSWRLVSPPDTKKSLSSWIAYRDRMIPSLALGPTEFLADRLARIGEVDLAVGQWLWIATSLPERHNRVERALRSAEKLLQNAGRIDEAARTAQWLNNLHGLSE